MQRLQYEVDIHDQHAAPENKIQDHVRLEILLGWVEGVPFLTNLYK